MWIPMYMIHSQFFLEGIYNLKFIDYCYSLKYVGLHLLLIHSLIYPIILSFINSLYKYLLSTLYVASLLGAEDMYINRA